MNDVLKECFEDPTEVSSQMRERHNLYKGIIRIVNLVDNVY